MVRHFLDIADLDTATLRTIIEDSRRMKADRRGEKPLDGKILAMIFDRPSTRTRVSFDVAMRQLGGETIVLTGEEMQRNRGETISDTAKVLSRYVSAIMIRTLDHQTVTELAREGTVPVINGLTKYSHPCQIMADILTFEEHVGPIAGRTLTWLGDANNMLTSWIQASARFDFTLRIATPEALPVSDAALAWASENGARLDVTHDARAAAEGSDCLMTDTWVSMGDSDAEKRKALLKPYQVDIALMKRAAPNAIFMHCLPAHREDEVTAEVIDGPQSVVFDEAENRLHAQKGILAWCFGAEDAGE